MILGPSDRFMQPFNTTFKLHMKGEMTTSANSENTTFSKIVQYLHVIYMSFLTKFGAHIFISGINNVTH